MNKYIKLLLVVFLVTGIVFDKPVLAEENLRLGIIDYPYNINPLPGGLNDSLVANSNSPEVIKTDGILLSTFPKEGKFNREAHLDTTLQGKFDIFAHHIAVERSKGDFTNVFEGILLQNPTKKIVTLTILASATYTTGPDAPFLRLADYLRNDEGSIFAGPGDKVSQDVLREKNHYNEKVIKINPGEFFLLMNEPIPISPLASINGKTTLFKLDTDGPLYVADLAIFQKDSLLFWKDSKPNINDWIDLLKYGKLAEKRDHIPTPINRPYNDTFYYSRVSGVAAGNKWKSRIINQGNYFKIPKKDDGVAFALNTVYNNTLGTGQVQSGVMIKRYDDTAYQSHANYGVTYEIEIPLYNANKEATSVAISFDSPVRLYRDIPQGKINYYYEPPDKVTFRGEFKVEYKSYLGIEKEKYIHVVQRFGQQGLPLVSIYMDPGDKKNVKITYIYPADCTPPHVLTITSN